MTEPFRIGEPELEDDDDDQVEDGDDVCEHGVSFSDDCEDCEEIENELDDDEDLDDDDELEDS